MLKWSSWLERERFHRIASTWRGSEGVWELLSTRGDGAVVTKMGRARADRHVTDKGTIGVRFCTDSLLDLDGCRLWLELHRQDAQPRMSECCQGPQRAQAKQRKQKPSPRSSSFKFKARPLHPGPRLCGVDTPTWTPLQPWDKEGDNGDKQR